MSEGVDEWAVPTLEGSSIAAGEARAVEAGAATEPGVDTLPGDLAPGAAFERDEAAPEGSPRRIDRYLIIRELGAGAMGKVFLAYDAELDRRVAIKLLHDRKANQRAGRRLQREAQAMAQLSHPNVVTVYEVGRQGEELYVVMEYVQGSDLRRWQRAADRGIAETLALFSAAGEGLAAAHDAGLVHRDFKPDNVLVGEDGRVRVADFGLAHARLRGEESGLTPVSRSQRIEALEELGSGSGPDSGSASRSGEESEGYAGTQASLSASLDATQTSELAVKGLAQAPELEHFLRPSVLEATLTRDGALLGSPAYMSPEQFAGRTGDARSDQFSFCVALWEGLYGSRPFSGTNVFKLARAIACDPPKRPRREGPALVPEWLEAVLVRGMAKEPEARWPDMHALLEALADDPRVRRRRWLQRGAAAVAIAGTLAGGSVWGARQLRTNAEQRYWNELTGELLALERERSLRQANDDAERARDATKMSVHQRYGAEPTAKAATPRDPAMAAVLLREVGARGRSSSAWLSAANATLGLSMSHARLQGHAAPVLGLVFAGQGQGLYSLAKDGELRAWDWARGAGELLRAPPTEGAGGVALARSPDGRSLAVAYSDGSVWLVAVEDGEARLVSEDAMVATALGFDASGRTLAVGRRRGALRLFDTATGLEPGAEVFDHQNESPRAIDFDGAGRMLVASGAAAWLWEVDNHALIARLDGHEDEVFHARFLDGDWALTGADDRSLRLWSVRPGAEDASAPRWSAALSQPISAMAVRGTSFAGADASGQLLGGRLDLATGAVSSVSLEGHAQGVWSLGLGVDGRTVVSAGFDGVAKVQTLDEGGSARVLRGHREGIVTASLDASGRWLATGSWDTDVRVWDLAREPLSRELSGTGAPVQAVAAEGEALASPRVLTAARDGRVRLWDAGSGAALGSSAGGEALNVAAFSPDGRRVAMGDRSGQVRAWTPGEDEGVVIGRHRRAVWDLAFSPDGSRLATVSGDGSGRIWALDSGESVTPSVVLEGHEGRVEQVAFGAQRVYTAGSDNSVRAWEARTGAQAQVFEGHRAAVRALALSPDRRRLATASDDREARLWSLDKAGASVILEGHSQGLTALAFDPSGARLATASADHDARVWSTRTGELLHLLRGHEGSVLGVVFVDEQRLLSHGDDAQVRLWLLGEPGEEPAVIVLDGHGGAVLEVAVTAEGRWAVSGALDGTARVWDLERLSFEPPELLEALHAATTSCLSVDWRMRELGENAAEAEATWAYCEAAQGR
ncbi:Peptidase C14, caspase catalytic subunit p20 [Plesiocystis pacifica SIR-1]|uniref:Peptidase C14, caspase catalytic subunit p20 n=1 Tax=Plesiocystis pacifica SIR-1 TaxID=391625 RepID=A6G4E4_9BACT|nr:protein kinase [Plesiocystis pacifica]EDM79256.1 Peptidase C14, caspase catalytic subunit p20 [Plesiocystis pacifica SIR-1]